MSDAPFPYEGPEDLRQPVTAALSRVVDPEVALNIVDIGLVYGVRIEADRLELRLTMTSAACPVADVIVDDAAAELERVLPAEIDVEVELVWEPAWTPERMSERARRFMRW
jgi:metal-sulfur cluster biosynthetic enzyme